MRMYVLGSAEVVEAFALGGMPGREVNDRRQALAALDGDALEGHRGLLVIEDRIAELVRDRVDALKLDPAGPLLVEIPGIAGPVGKRRTPMEMVRRALGIKI